MSQGRESYGRKRSNTQSSLRPPSTVTTATPVQINDSKLLKLWIHHEDDRTVRLNPDAWPGISEGDLIQVSQPNASYDLSQFVFEVKVTDESRKARLQISVPKKLAEKFGIELFNEVLCTKVHRDHFLADHVEFAFKDQYLGRPDMWRFAKFLNGQCIHVHEEIVLPGVASATVQNIFIKGKRALSAQVAAHTKSIFRSLSAKVTIFIQVCEELWQFASDGERYYEKIAHSFLPELFSRWHDGGTNHTVTIVLISRVFYDQSEIDYAAGPLRQEEAFDNRWFKDFYKVITDLEIIYDWKPILASLKDSLFAFQRDILLTHHYHQAAHSEMSGPENVRLVGKLSYAHEGPILEAFNMSLNPSDSHYIDRSLSMTGISNILITPGTGHFRSSKSLLRLTTSRILDQGFALDLISLAKPPLHRTPIFSFKGVVPELSGQDFGPSKAGDPLWYDDQETKMDSAVKKEQSLFWWEPFWINVTFWDLQMDLPFRDDRFVAVCKMHDIQMLGLLELDIVSAIEIPWLDSPVTTEEQMEPALLKEKRVLEASQFDQAVFATTRKASETALATKIGSYQSPTSTGTVTLPSSVRSSLSDRMHANQRMPEAVGFRFPTIEEKSSRENSPAPSGRRPPALISRNSPAIAVTSKEEAQSAYQPPVEIAPSVSIPSANPPPSKDAVAPFSGWRFSSASWFNPFRQNSPVPPDEKEEPPKPTASTSPQTPVQLPTGPQSSPRPVRSRITPTQTTAHTQRRSRTISDHDFRTSQRLSQLRNTGMPVSSSPPREELYHPSRRSTRASFNRIQTGSFRSVDPVNPSQPPRVIPYTHVALSKRWKDIFPRPSFKNEIKWKSLITPGCLPLTTDDFPSQHEINNDYDVHPYDFVLQPAEIQSFFLRNPVHKKSAPSDARDALALSILRGMVSWRLAQGFQFVSRPSFECRSEQAERHDSLSIPPRPSRTGSFLTMDDEHFPKPVGAADVLKDVTDPIYLSMSNEIHRLSYIGDSIHVRRYVRRMALMNPFEYACLVWPKQGDGYKVSKVTFPSKPFLEDYGWNRMDMLIAGYEHAFSDNMKYWRTRFLVLPSSDPKESTAPSGEQLSEEESRLQGIDKLAEIFGKHRWNDGSEKDRTQAAPRFLPTYLGPAACVLDDSLVTQLELIHEQGPLKKKSRPDKIIALMTHAALSKSIREAEPSLIRDYRWHNTITNAAFTGHELVSWLVKEFQDVSSREEGVIWGQKLMDQGFIEHHRRYHGFLDGHYFYRLRGEHAIPNTPRSRWWRPTSVEEREALVDSTNPLSPKSNRRLILSQQMIVDVDPPPSRKSDQPEIALLHHDIIHNASTCFHFELHWIGTSASCIDQMIRSWQSRVEKYGLKLVEAYVDEISSVSSRNPFQSFYPIHLALRPPQATALAAARLGDEQGNSHFFENAILTRRFGFVLDIEAASHYPQSIEVYYSYRRAPFTYSQYVHKTGIAFVQVLGGAQGYRFLTNRLLQQSRKEAASADQLRRDLHDFCSDPVALSAFYDTVAADFDSSEKLSDPPPLEI